MAASPSRRELPRASPGSSAGCSTACSRAGHRQHRASALIAPPAPPALVFAAFAPKFHVIPGGHYLLGSFWPTWFLAATTAASLPISWGPFVGDYGRYIPSGASPRVVGAYGFFGIFLGCWLAMVAAALAATSARQHAAELGLDDLAAQEVSGTA